MAVFCLAIFHFKGINLLQLVTQMSEFPYPYHANATLENKRL